LNKATTGVSGTNRGFAKKIDPGLPLEGTQLDDIAAECRAIIEEARQNATAAFFG